MSMQAAQTVTLNNSKLTVCFCGIAAHGSYINRLYKFQKEDFSSLSLSHTHVTSISDMFWQKLKSERIYEVRKMVWSITRRVLSRAPLGLGTLLLHIRHLPGLSFICSPTFGEPSQMFRNTLSTKKGSLGSWAWIEVAISGPQFQIMLSNYS